MRKSRAETLFYSLISLVILINFASCEVELNSATTQRNLVIKGYEGCLIEDVPEYVVIEESNIIEEESYIEEEESNYPTHSILTKSGGVNYYNGFKETYYNLPMSQVVKNMNNLGYDYEYWIREDGVKMFGDYVMIGASLELFSKGDITETSLGTAIVCDTGEFARENMYQIDIAVSW